MRSPRRWLVLLLLIAVPVGAVLLVLRTAPAREWLWEVTGEEDLWEGVKGVGAATLLELTGPDPTLAPMAPIAGRGPGPYGVNTFLQLEVEPENVRRSLAMLRDAGVGWARQEFPWEDIEIHGRGDFEDRRHEPHRSAWEKYDRIVGMAEDHGIELLVRLSNPPDWAFADPEAAGEKGPPDDLADFGRFVSAVAERYCGRVRYYQIWNEPNIYPEWGERDVDPAGYAELISVAAGAARAACDDVVIVSAGLAPTTEPGGRNMSDLAYLEALYELGWADDFDILGAQAFGLWTGPTDQRLSADRVNFARPQLLRDIMVRHDDAATPVWFTEMGWASPPETVDAPGCEPVAIDAQYGRVTEARRAVYTVAAYERMAAAWPWAEVGFLWFFRRPDWTWHCAPQGYGYFRLVEPDWTPTVTFNALADLATRPPVAPRGRHAPDSRALAYSGPWRDVAPGDPLAPRVGLPTAEVQLVFRGTDVELRFRAPSGDEDPPQLFLVVDDRQQTLSPAPAGDNQLALVTDGLADAEHLLIARVESGEAWLDEVVVRAPAPSSPLRPLLWAGRALAALAVLGIAVALAVVWRTRRRSAAEA